MTTFVNFHLPKYSSKKLWENPIGQKLHEDVAQGLSEVRKINSTDLVKVVYGENIVVNATEMAKAFGKLPADFLKTQRAQDYIMQLTVMKNIITADIVKVVQGGNNTQGTWMHEDIAIEFARLRNCNPADWIG